MKGVVTWFRLNKGNMTDLVESPPLSPVYFKPTPGLGEIDLHNSFSVTTLLIHIPEGIKKKKG